MAQPPPRRTTRSLDESLRDALISEDIKRSLLEFLQHLAYERRVSMATVTAYASDLRVVFEEAARLGVKRLAALEVGTINTILDAARWRQGRPLHARSVGRKHTALRTFYRWAIDHVADDLVDPTPWLITPPQPRKPPKPLLVPTALTLVQKPQKEANGPDTHTTARADAVQLRDVAALLLMYGPGLMRHETLELRLEDVNLQERWLRVRGRGRKTREVPIPQGCVADLQAYLDARGQTDNPYFLCGRAQQPLGARTLLRIVARAAQSMLGHHATPRQLRHSFATHLVADGARPGHIQQMLGHSTAKATERYREVAMSELRTMMRASHPRARPEP